MEFLCLLVEKILNKINISSHICIIRQNTPDCIKLKSCCLGYRINSKPSYNAFLKYPFSSHPCPNLTTIQAKQAHIASRSVLRVFFHAQNPTMITKILIPNSTARKPRASAKGPVIASGKLKAILTALF